jgi:hypothetical protein
MNVSIMIFVPLGLHARSRCRWCREVWDAKVTCWWHRRRWLTLRHVELGNLRIQHFVLPTSLQFCKDVVVNTILLELGADIVHHVVDDSAINLRNNPVGHRFR